MLDICIWKCFNDYIDMGALTDIDEYFTDEEKENYLYYELGNIQEGQYALPVVVGNPRILVANMDLLKEAGIDKIPTNWDNWLVHAKKSKKAIQMWHRFFRIGEILTMDL